MWKAHRTLRAWLGSQNNEAHRVVEKIYIYIFSSGGVVQTHTHTQPTYRLWGDASRMLLHSLGWLLYHTSDGHGTHTHTHTASNVLAARRKCADHSFSRCSSAGRTRLPRHLLLRTDKFRQIYSTFVFCIVRRPGRLQRAQANTTSTH